MTRSPTTGSDRVKLSHCRVIRWSIMWPRSCVGRSTCCDRPNEYNNSWYCLEKVSFLLSQWIFRSPPRIIGLPPKQKLSRKSVNSGRNCALEKDGGLYMHNSLIDLFSHEKDISICSKDWYVGVLRTWGSSSSLHNMATPPPFEALRSVLKREKPSGVNSRGIKTSSDFSHVSVIHDRAMLFSKTRGLINE